MAYQNFYATRLAADITAADTTITVETPPSVTSGRLTLEARNANQREIVRFTGVSGNQLTGVTRGQGGTMALAHARNSLVEMNATAEDMADALAVPSDIITRFDESFANFVASGMMWSKVTLLTGTMTSGVIYIDGYRINVSAVASQAFPASRDTYVDVDVTGTIYYTSVTNGATTGYTLTAGRIRLAKVVTDGTGITSVVTAGGDAAGSRIRPTSSVDAPHFCSQFFSTGSSSGGQVITNVETSYIFDVTDPNAYGITSTLGAGAYMTIVRDGVYRIDHQTNVTDMPNGSLFICWFDFSKDNGVTWYRFRQAARSLDNGSGGQVYSITSWLPAGARVKTSIYNGSGSIRLAGITNSFEDRYWTGPRVTITEQR